ncbi:MAG: hypothetical protein ACRCYU_12235 [Nocardioides sp.]
MDVIEGRGPSPSLVLLLIQRLPDTSATMALRLGGWEHFGWGQDRHLRADVYDALNLNTRASGNWGRKSAPKIPAYKRPEPPKKKKGKMSPAEMLQTLYARMQKGR